MTQSHLLATRIALPPRAARRLAALALGVAAGLAGCAVHPKIDARPEYPAGKEFGASADIQVVRQGVSIIFTNTTARPLPPGAIWANSAYSRDFPGLAVGESISLNLGEFTNRFGEPFRPGGFFATERPQALVRIQIETDYELIGLTVIGGTLE